MALVPLVAEEQADPLDAAALAGGHAAYGQLLNTWRAIANRPGLFAAYLPFLRTVAGPGALDQQIKELSAVRVAVLNHCRYTASHRSASARSQGVSDEDLAAVAAGELDRFPEPVQVALELTRALTVDQTEISLASNPTGVDPGLMKRAQELFEPDELVELVMSIGVWNALTRFHRAMGFELDMPAPPAAVDALL
jgi:AhpD family alkylhydroperoxidase